MSGTQVGIILGGTASGGGGSSTGNNLPDTIEDDYAELVANGSNVLQSTGAKVLELDAGSLSTASPAQIGRVINGVTITAAMVQQNQALLNAIGADCRANNISIHIEAQLDNAPQGDWTYQWLDPAVAAGLPITEVENVDEDASSPDTAANYAGIAQNEVAIVKQITQYFPTVQIGQWVGGSSAQATSDWISAYDTAAKAAKLPGISTLVADTSWNTPWVTPASNWQPWLQGLSTVAKTYGGQLEVLLDGDNTEGSDQQWTAQSEQHAEMLAMTPGVTVSAVLLTTWNLAYINAVLPINTPTTLGNDAIEIEATYPLYASGSITAQGSIALTTPGQAIVTTGSTTALGSIALGWTASDVTAGRSAAVVLVDATGHLSATCAKGGTVSGAGTNELILNGNSAALTAELATLSVTDTASGPDSIDVEVFGANGRLADSQISILALPNGTKSGAGTYSFQSPTPGQSWTSASVIVGSNGAITAATYTWNANDQNATTGQYQVVRTDTLHEPLAASGVIMVNGVPKEPLSNPQASSPGSLPLNMPYWNGSAFNPATQLTTINVLSTTLSYDVKGLLQTVRDALPATTPTSGIIGGSLPNYFTTGGLQITQLNTGDNSNWEPGWSSGLASVTTTYDSAGQVIEQQFQGGATNPSFSLDNVFDPYRPSTLWAQFETTPPPSGYGTFVTGDEYVTLFNTGDNPYWDYTDWGTKSQVTITFEDYYAKAVSTVSPVPTGLQDTDAYNFGSAVFGTGSSASICVLGGATICATTATEIINTGTGGSSVSLSQGSTQQVSIYSGGNDTIQAGQASFAITNTGTPDTVYASSGSASVQGNSSVNFIGSSEFINAGAATVVNATGNNNTVSLNACAATATVVGNASTVIASSASSQDVINLNGTNDIAQTCNGGTVFLNGNTDIATVGTNANGTLSACGDKLTALDGLTASASGANATISAGNQANITLTGTANVASALAASTILTYSAQDQATLQANGTIGLFGTTDVGNGGTNTFAYVAGTNNKLTVAAGSDANVVGATATVTAGNAANISMAGSGDTGTAGINSNGYLSGTKESLSLGNGSYVGDVGTFNTDAVANSGVVSIAGSHDIGTGGTGCSGYISGTLDSITFADQSNIGVVGSSSTAIVRNNSAISMCGSNDSGTGGTAGQGYMSGYEDALTFGNGSTIIAVGSTEVAVGGNSSTFNLSGISDSGTGGTACVAWVAGTSERLSLCDNASVTIVGTSGTVALGNAGNLSIGGTKNIGTLGAAANVWLGGTYNGVTAGAQANIVVVGGNDTFSVTNNSTLTLSGTNDSGTGGASCSAWLAGTSCGLTLGDNSTASMVGTSGSVTMGNSCNLSVGGTGNVGTMGTGAIGWLGGMCSQLTAGAQANLIVAGGYDTLTVGNNSSVTVANTSTQSTIDLNGNNDTAQLNAAGTVALNGTLDIANGGNGVTVNIAGASDTATLLANASVNVSGKSDSVTVGNSSTVIATATASNESVTLGGSNDYTLIGSGALATIRGALDTVAIAQGGGTQTVNGFSLTNGDQIDLSQLLVGDVGLTNLSTLANYVSVASSGSNAIMTVSTSSHVQDTIVLAGLGQTSLSGLSSHNNLVLFHS